jgi:hypothetical protein|tara:strand:+ start:7 stop:237 length:231 start_codon:yes stop_codon:yes gene_type:complete
MNLKMRYDDLATTKIMESQPQCIGAAQYCLLCCRLIATIGRTTNKNILFRDRCEVGMAIGIIYGITGQLLLKTIHQ